MTHERRTTPTGDLLGGKHAQVSKSTVVRGLLLAPILLSGCSVEASRGADPYKPSIGSNARTEQIDALGVAIVIDSNRNGRVVGTLVNTENPQHA